MRLRAQCNIRGRVALLGVALLIGNALTWLWALLAFRHQPLLLGAALLAYGFGLRHAVDADHIAAIDNVTRRLMQRGRTPLTVGLFFSLGHSTVVTVLTLGVAIAARRMSHQFASLRLMGGVLGTAISAFFLFAIGAANLIILAKTWRDFRAASTARSDRSTPLAVPGGLLVRLWQGLFHLIEHSGQMYAVGILFGLGFDTATEVGLLGVSAQGAAKGLSLGAVLVLPALFCAGMALIDTADNLLMAGAYGWAFVKPIRKLYYNLTLTSLSVLVALGVGAIETLGLLQGRLASRAPFWHLIGVVNEHFDALGYGIIGLFAVGWLVSLLIYKLAGYEAA